MRMDAVTTGLWLAAELGTLHRITGWSPFAVVPPRLHSLCYEHLL